MVQQPEVFQRLVELKSDSFAWWWARGLMFANQRQWSKAANDCAKSLEFLNELSDPPGANIVQSLATLRLLAGDEPGYLELREIILTKMDRISDPSSANMLSRACTLRPSDSKTGSVPINLAERALATDAKRAWYLYGLGAAYYRAGRHDDAIPLMKESLSLSPRWGGRAQNQVMLAMACHQLNHKDEALRWLEAAKASLQQLEQNIGSGKFGFAESTFINDWLAIQVLIAEAEKLLSVSDRD